ncbi:MAG: response regulator [Bacteroidota bacterium]|nr:response regulator [Bacteroidota bacterium]
MRLSIRDKLNVSILSAVLIVLALLVSFFSFNIRKQAKADSFQLNDNTAEKISSRATSLFNIDLGITRALANSYQGYAGQPKEELKEMYQKYLEQGIKQNSNYLALWISLELAEIDPSYTGTYERVTWLYDKLSGDYEFRSESRDTDPNNLSPQYQANKENKNESLVDPYWYKPNYEGATIDSLMETTVAVPVLKDDKVVGIAGIDFTLQQLNDLSFNVQGEDTIQATIFSFNGIIVTHSNPDMIGKKISELNIFNDEWNSILDDIQLGEKFNKSIKLDEGEYYYSFSPIKIGKSATPWSVCVEVPYKEVLRTANGVFLQSLLIGLLGLILLGIVVYVLSTRIIKPIEATTKQLEILAEGRIDQVEILDTNSKDEIGSMARALNSLNNKFLAITSFSKSIGEGRLNVKYPYTSDHDSLGIAMTTMQDNLIKLDNETNQQDWVKSGLNGLNEQIRGDRNLTEIAKIMISYLAKYLGAKAGALYISESGSNILKLAAGYAFTKRKELNTRIEYGEGLVGQCAIEKELIILTEVPEAYFPIKSATGSANPKNVIVFPCIFNEEVLGVIELASFGEYTDLQLEFLDSASQSMAIGLNSARAKDEMKKLLAQTLEQKEELQAQEEELREANQELEKQANNLRKSEASLQAQQEEMIVTNQELEKNAQMLEEQAEKINEKNKQLEITRQEIEKKADELASASQYKSDFLSNMSHELRTPLNSMLILSQSLAENSDGHLEADEVESAQIIYKSGKDLLNLINEVLDLSKIEAGKMVINFDKVDIEAISENVYSLFKTSIEDKGLEFIISIDSDAPKTIVTDQLRVEQIIKNLLSNSSKFTSDGSIELKFFKPSAEHKIARAGLNHQNSIGISVSDTGIGISEEKQKMIFEAFQQEDGSTSRKYGGTGLGLSISKELAVILGGELQLKSTQGEGSVFSIILPFESDSTKSHSETATVLNTNQANPVTKNPIPAPKGQAEAIDKADEQIIKIEPASTPFISDDLDQINPDDQTMLIIEDDPEFAKILLKQCHKQGFKCITAGTGENGLWLASEHLPVAIILDIKLPGINGWKVLDSLKKNPKTRHIPVHMMSAMEQTLEAFQKGAIGYLTKPVSTEQLHGAFGKIERFVDQKMKKLLIVEDDPQMRKTIQKVIKGKDIQISEVSTANDCMKEIRSSVFDCLILDLGLPDMDGFELLKQLKSIKNYPIPPIIVYTGQELTREQDLELHKYTSSIIIKGVKSEERLLDETALFLHRMVGELDEKQQKIIHSLYEKENLFKEKKILLVDDDMRNVFALTRVFEEKGMIVLKAENGRKAIQVLKENPSVDLIMMDIMMPEMDGYEAMTEIRKLSEFKTIPIIALTAKAMKEDKQKCLDAGASDYITKPLDVPKMMSLMRVWLYK